MNQTNRTHLSLDDEHRARLVELAEREGRPMTTIVEDALDEYGAKTCACNGNGIAFRHRGEWIYCACRAGLDAEMAHMSGQLQAIAETMDRLRKISAENSQEYSDLAFQFDRITAEHDDLERQWAEVLQ